MIPRDRCRPRHQQQLVADTIQLVSALRHWIAGVAPARAARLQPWWSAVQIATGGSRRPLTPPVQCVLRARSTRARGSAAPRPFTPAKENPGRARSRGERESAADLYAQSLGAGLALVLQRPHNLLRPNVQRWLIGSANPLWRDLLIDLYGWLDGRPLDGFGRADPSAQAALDRLRRRCEPSVWQGQLVGRDLAALDASDPVQFLEHFLSACDAGRRKRRGVFYTPRAIAHFVISQLDHQLAAECGMAGGLADTISWSDFLARHRQLSPPCGESLQSPVVHLLDPALGSGVFLQEAIRAIHRRLDERWRQENCPARDRAARWEAYVTENLLPRLVGLEIMLPACLAAHLNVADQLAETGFGFSQPARVEIHLTDTLCGPRPGLDALCERLPSVYAAAVQAAERVACARPLTVIAGNPPFSGISQTEAAWIGGLLRGQEPTTPAAADYYRAAGRGLGERKLWLQDDYVKFLRYAHWHVERAGWGLIGLVTNHGYLDNPTFRGLRFQLLQTFPRIDVLDLHGNLKKKESAPGGGRDQNVFGIASGAAIGFFRRSPDLANGQDRRAAASSPKESAGAETAAVGHQELWGSAADKLARLEAIDGRPWPPPDVAARWTPQAPLYLFVPRDRSRDAEYCGGYRLTELMPMNVTAPVTARDGFVVALEREELLRRIESFRDLSLPDNRIRQQFFRNTRSAKYPPGDTRGWSLAEARRCLAADRGWEEPIRPCWYRPFDRRWVYWSAAMIDWPRSEVVTHLLAGPNLALIARRQMLPSQPCTYFWITDDLALDGIIRSDNRGSESLFPLYRYGVGDGRTPHPTPNLQAGFLAELEHRLGLGRIVDRPQGRAERSLDGLDVLAYCYGLFHSPTYRQRYAEQLRTDFPRVFLPATAGLFHRLSGYGRRLIDAHLLRSATAATAAAAGGADADWHVAAGYPRYQGGSVWVNARCRFEGVPPEVWEFAAGGHQPGRKWLKDRRGRELSRADRSTYVRIVAAIGLTLRCSRRIDQAIDRAGGWPAAFAWPRG